MTESLKKMGVAKSWTAKSFFWGKQCIAARVCSGASMTADFSVAAVYDCRAAVYDCRETTESWTSKSFFQVVPHSILKDK
ncbi:MAG: hypothetical protein ACKOHM_07210 [Spartobacteria bacterium]